MHDPCDYTITVRRFHEDDVYVFRATVKELPHVIGMGDNYSEAYEMALEAIDGLQEMAVEDGAKFPEPIQESSSEWSGRVTLRLPKSLHRCATEVADEEGVSLNQFLVTVIADAVARRSAVSITNYRMDTTLMTLSQAFANSWSKKGTILYENIGTAMTTQSTPIGTVISDSRNPLHAGSFVVPELTGNG